MLIPCEGDENEERKLHIVDLYDEILSKINESSQWFATFVALLSPSIWKSPSELAEAWLHLVAKNEYAELIKADADLEVEKIKRAMQHDLIILLGQNLHLLSRNPSLVQSITSALLVMETLSQDLHIYDQDRVIAKTLGIPYRTWQGIIGVLSSHPQFLDIFQKSHTIVSSWLNSDGSTMHSMSIRHADYSEIKPLEAAIPGLEIWEVTVELSWVNSQWRIVSGTENVSVILLHQNVLRRYEDIIHWDSQYEQVRKCIDQKYGNIPTWKRRSFWGNSPKESEEYGLVPVGARK